MRSKRLLALIPLALAGSTASADVLITSGTTTATSDAGLGPLGEPIVFDNNATLRYGVAFDTARNITINAGGGTMETPGSGQSIVSGVISGPGLLSKTGTGTLTLTGANTYSGGTTIAAGTLQIGNNGTSGSIVGNVTNNGALTFNRSDNLTHAGAISGTGTLTKLGAGTLTLTGANTYTGTTTITAGTVQVGTGGTTGTIGSSGGVIVNNGTLVFNRSDEVSAPAMSGSGALVQQGTGTLILTGDTVHTGGTTITQGTLQVGAGGSTGTLVGQVANSGTLVFNRNDNLTFGGAVSGTGTLVKRGAGILILTGDNTFTGATQIEAGTLSLANSSIGSAQIAAGGRLAGTGVVRGNLVNNGVVSPGTSPGTITINGNYTQSAGGRYVAEAASATSYDRLLVNGTASLDGTLEMIALNGFVPAAGQTYNILTANAVTGRFATVLTSAFNLAPGTRFDATYSSTGVTVEVIRSLYAPQATTSNRAAVGGALDSAAAAGRGTTLQAALAGYLDAAGVDEGLRQLSPQRYGHWYSAALSGNEALERTVQARRSEATAGREAWAEVTHRDADFASDREVGSADLDADGIVAGVEQHGVQNSSVGVLLAYEDIKYDARGSNRLTIFQPAAYLRHATGPWSFHAMAAYGWQDYDGARRISLPGYVQVAQASTSAQHWSAGAQAAYTLKRGDWVITPQAGLRYFDWRADAFQEAYANEAGLRLAEQKGDSLASRLSVNVARTWRVQGMAVTPQLEVGWRHEFEDSRRSIRAELAGSAFTVRTAKPQTDGGFAALGFDAQVSAQASAYLRVQREMDTAVKRSTDFRAGVSYRF